MLENNIQTIIAGAVIGSVLGSAGSLLVSNQNGVPKNSMVPQAAPFLSGTVIGALIGAASALLIAPKSGRLIRRDLSEGYQDLADKTHEYLDSWIEAPPVKKRVRKAMKQIKKIAKAKHH